ncbi:MAG: VOC family protein [Pseudomonadota bacterium]|nr:VOC family protein [Pseudomonadota bacterium]
MQHIATATHFDHLVVLADTLEEGAAWCQATLGVAPLPGGRHARFGTHNRLLNIASQAWPQAYLEIIAIDPAAGQVGGHTNGSKRWYDMDVAALRESVRRHGPQLIHWVAAVPDIDAAVARLATLDIDRGDVLSVSRMTAAGPLHWRIAVRPDGQRLMEGCLPTLIEWGDTHPISTMPASGVRLRALQLSHPRAEALRAVLQAIGATQVDLSTGPACIRAELDTPKGPVRLKSCT